MASSITDAFKAQVLQGTINLGTTTPHTIKCALYTGSVAASTLAAYTSTSECPSTGNYSAGGATLANKTITGTTTVTWDADDVTWASSTISSATYAVLYDDSASPKHTIAVIDFGGAKSSSAGDFKITWSGSGILTLAG